MDMKLELVPVPVSNVDSAKDFYWASWGSTKTTTPGSVRLRVSCS
jgi:hypothetical protein